MIHNEKTLFFALPGLRRSRNKGPKRTTKGSEERGAIENMQLISHLKINYWRSRDKGPKAV